MTDSLSERERQVLEVVIETYVQTAEPAASRTIARRSRLGLSPASIRNTMSDLEEKGYLYHPHTSAGRIPTDLAYRVYVDSLMRPSRVAAEHAERLHDQLSGERAAVEAILARAAQVLGVLTHELGVAVSPSFDDAVLERLELVQVSSDRLLLVMTLRSGVVRTIFVEVPSVMAPEVVAQVTATDPDTVVTDMTSVKAPEALGLTSTPRGWVGGHPMAGTERTGFAAARLPLTLGIGQAVTIPVKLAFAAASDAVEMSSPSKTIRPAAGPSAAPSSTSVSSSGRLTS